MKCMQPKRSWNSNPSAKRIFCMSPYSRSVIPAEAHRCRQIACWRWQQLEKAEIAELATKNSCSFESEAPWSCTTTSTQRRFEMEELKKKTTPEVVNWDPSFGSSLLNDNFGQRLTEDDDLKALDPLKLEAVETQQDARATTENAEKGVESPTTQDPLLRNPHGATQMFTDMHGAPSGIEGTAEMEGAAKTGMRHMAGLTVGAQRLGITDWGSGTDGGRSGKPQDGVPYGSFTGV